MSDDDSVVSRLDKRGRLHLRHVPRDRAAAIVNDPHLMVGLTRVEASIDEAGTVLNNRVDLRLTLLTDLSAADHAMELLRLVATANGVEPRRVLERPSNFL